MKKKSIIIIAISLIVISIISLMVYFNSSYKLNKDRINLLRDMASKYYSEFYYDAVSVDSIKTFESSGITVDLSSLKDTQLFDNKKYKKLDSCSNNTRVRIIPKSPYGNKDFKIEIVNIDCK